MNIIISITSHSWNLYCDHNYWLLFLEIGIACGCLCCAITTMSHFSLSRNTFHHPFLSFHNDHYSMISDFIIVFKTICFLFDCFLLLLLLSNCKCILFNFNIYNINICIILIIINNFLIFLHGPCGPEDIIATLQFLYFVPYHTYNPQWRNSFEDNI